MRIWVLLISPKRNKNLISNSWLMQLFYKIIEKGYISGCIRWNLSLFAFRRIYPDLSVFFRLYAVYFIKSFDQKRFFLTSMLIWFFMYMFYYLAWKRHELKKSVFVVFSESWFLKKRINRSLINLKNQRT